MHRRNHVWRGMLAGLVGAGTATWLFVVLFTVYAYLASESPRDPWAPPLLERITNFLFLLLFARPIWVPVGLAAGGGLGHIVGPRPAGRRAIAVCAAPLALFGRAGRSGNDKAGRTGSYERAQPAAYALTPPFGHGLRTPVRLPRCGVD